MTRKETIHELRELKDTIRKRMLRHMVNQGPTGKPYLRWTRQIEALDYCEMQIERIAVEIKEA